MLLKADKRQREKKWKLGGKSIGYSRSEILKCLFYRPETNPGGGIDRPVYRQSGAQVLQQYAP